MSMLLLSLQSSRVDVFVVAVVVVEEEKKEEEVEEKLRSEISVVSVATFAATENSKSRQTTSLMLMGETFCCIGICTKITASHPSAECSVREQQQQLRSPARQDLPAIWQDLSCQRRVKRSGAYTRQPASQPAGRLDRTFEYMHPRIGHSVHSGLTTRSKKQITFARHSVSPRRSKRRGSDVN